MATRSWVRMRVASSDWCASRMVVSVTSSRVCARIHWANFSGPISSSACLVPWGGVATSLSGGCTKARDTVWAASLVSGLPFTVTFPMKLKSRVARSLRGVNANSSGVSSMKRVE